MGRAMPTTPLYLLTLWLALFLLHTSIARDLLIETASYEDSSEAGTDHLDKMAGINRVEIEYTNIPKEPKKKGSDDTGKYKSKKSQGSQHSDNKADGRDYTSGEPEDISYDNSYDYYSSEECDSQVFHCDEPEEPAYLKLKDHCKGKSSNKQCNGQENGTPCIKNCRHPDCKKAKCCKGCCK